MRSNIKEESPSRIHNVFASKGLPINISSIINSYKADELSHYIIGTIGVQLALADVLKELEITPKQALGYSLGAIAAFYTEDHIDFEQAVLAAYFTNLTLSDVVKKDEGLVLDVNKSKTAQQLLKYFKQFLPNSTPFQPAYSQIIGKQKTLSEELVERIINPDYRRLVAEINPNSVVLEVGSDLMYKVRNGLFENSNNGFGTDWNEEVTTFQLVEIGARDAVESLSEALGKLHLNGYDVPAEKLYPAVQFPVSRSTPMISHLVKWYHEKPCHIMNYKDYDTQVYGYRKQPVNTREQEWAYLTGHVVDGEFFSSFYGTTFQEFTVVFTSCMEFIGIYFQEGIYSQQPDI